MTLPRKMLALLLAGSAMAAPAAAQVATPPGPKPEPTPEYVPPAPPPQPAPRQQSPDVSNIPFESIAVWDSDGSLVPLEGPVEYIALSHNPLLDLEAMTKVAPLLYPRRLRVEQLVIDNLETMREIQGGLIQSMRMADEEAMREASGKVAAFTSSTDVPPYLYAEITGAFVEGRRLSKLTQTIMGDYQEALTKDAIGRPAGDDGSTGLDQMMQAVLRMSVAEYEYFYNRLMMDAADMLGAILPELSLDAPTAEAVAPLARRLQDEGDLDARAELIREVFDLLDPETRQRVLRMTIDLRPDVSPAEQMAPIPEGATARELDDETRKEMIFQLLDGGRVDTSAFLQ